MIVLHHLNNSRSQRILWMLEELGLEYDLKRYPRDAKTMLAPPELRAVHPLGKSPIVTDGDLTLVESGAILEYLVGRYGEGRFIPPAGTPERLRYTFWLHYAEGSVMPPMLLAFVFMRIEVAPMPFFVRPIAKGIARKVRAEFIDPQLETHLGYIEREMGKTSWLAGAELTAADVQMSFPLEAASSRAGITPEKEPHIHDWLKRIHARPAYQRALAKGGAYDYAAG
ncbi:MAG TPA: glutathione S-transferase [Polyangiaceae bacterium]|jgi:glutathione S-transferase